MRSKILAPAILIFILVVVPVASVGSQRQAGLAVGDKAIYKYLINTFQFTETGSRNVTVEWNITVRVDAINLTAGSYQFTEELDYVGNGSSPATAPYSTVVVNATYIYDPFVNVTYLGKLGFPAFVYTDVPTGTRSFPLTVETSGPPPWAAPNATAGVQNITVTSFRTTGALAVNFNDSLAQGAAPFIQVKQLFDPDVGVLRMMEMRTSISGVDRNFFYTLLNFSSNPPPNYTWTVYVVVVAVAGLVVYALMKRPSGSERKTKRMKEKFARKK